MVTTGWIEEAERLRFDLGLSWAEVTERLMQYFPNVSRSRAEERIRWQVRKRPRYKEEKQKELFLRARQLPSEPLTTSDDYKSKASVEYKSDGTVVSSKLIELAEGLELTPEVVVKAHGLDPAAWTVVTYVNNFWNAQQQGGQKLVMYQSKLTVRPNAKGLSFERIDSLFEKLDRKAEPIRITSPPKKDGVDIEINVADLHVGKFCWNPETGNSFDLDIARQVLSDILSDIIPQIKLLEARSILFVWSNDFFHIDSIENTTTAGTRQDVAGRWQDIFDVGVEMLTSAILTLREIAPVTTFYTPSNHDKMTGYHAVKLLEAFFRDDDRVTVDTSPKSKKFYQLGATLVGFCHGDKRGRNGTKERASFLASRMPIEVPEMWANAKYREFHAGHLHSEQMIEEINGVIVRRISSPTATDAWHDESDYVGAVRKAQTFIYHPTRGLVHIINTPVE